MPRTMPMILSRTGTAPATLKKSSTGSGSETLETEVSLAPGSSGAPSPSTCTPIEIEKVYHG